jgi:hypothetical protein
MTLLAPDKTRARLADYLTSMRAGAAIPGGRFASQLAGADLATLTEAALLNHLLNTKLPQIFAESAVAGDGSDWNLTELRLLGDLSISVPVTIFDDCNHRAPVPHEKPFAGTLVFTPGALLCNGRGQQPADWEEVTGPDGAICRDGYYGLYERRLLPVFRHVDASASSRGKHALITVPGLGCGMFAGPFKGQLGAELQTVFERFLTKHGESFPNIKAVYYDPFSQCDNARFEFHGVSLMVRPLLKGNATKSQLCAPADYAEDGDDFSECELFSIVAWDHVSWPGNDFFAGSRCTDDGVKAAATDSMSALTGVEGHYDPIRGAYLPPPPFSTWEEVVRASGKRLA